MNKSGFSLVELLISMVIASMLSIILFGALWSINRSATQIENLVQEYEKALLINNQLDRDISGAFIPVQAEKKKEEEKKAEARATQENAQPAAKPAQPPKKEKKPLENIFLGQNKDGQLILFTCITNNPLEVFWGKNWGKPIARIARVVYRLKEEKNRQKNSPKSYQLVRQESSELELGAFKSDARSNIKEFEIVSNIKSFTLTYFVNVTDKKTNKEELKSFKTWDKKQQEETGLQIPQIVTLTYQLWDTTKKRSINFTYAIAILPDFSQKDQKEKKQEEEKKAAAQPTPSASPAGPQPPQEVATTLNIEQTQQITIPVVDQQGPNAAGGLAQLIKRTTNQRAS
jgi:prepilin-type N-terminal cleavage/methylation domain-containing protein